MAAHKEDAMKTRVVKKFKHAVARNYYTVEYWGPWQVEDLRKSFPDDFDWRPCEDYETEKEALDRAGEISRLAEYDMLPLVIASFDNGNEQ